MKSEELAKYGGFFNVFYSFPCLWHQFSGFDFLSGYAKLPGKTSASWNNASGQLGQLGRVFSTLHARGRAGTFKNRGDT